MFGGATECRSIINIFFLLHYTAKTDCGLIGFMIVSYFSYSLTCISVFVVFSFFFHFCFGLPTNYFVFYFSSTFFLFYCNIFVFQQDLHFLCATLLCLFSTFFFLFLFFHSAFDMVMHFTWYSFLYLFRIFFSLSPRSSLSHIWFFYVCNIFFFMKRIISFLHSSCFTFYRFL